MNGIRERLAQRQVIVGMQCFSGAPSLVEIMGYSGLDWVSIDMEHHTKTFPQVEHLIRAAETSGIVPLVRVERNDPIDIMHALDSGAQGVIVPHIDTAADLRAALAAARYPPAGERGASSSVRACHYGISSWKEYVQRANESVIVVPLIESVEAIGNLDEILAVDGVDLLWIGVTDLALTLDLPGANLTHPRMQQIARDFNEKARKYGKALMGPAAPPLTMEYAEMLIDLGFRAISFGADESLFARTCRDIAAIGR